MKKAFGTASTMVVPVDDVKKKSGGTVMMSIRVPIEFKEKLAEMSKEQGVSQTELVISGVEDAASLSRALAAVDDYLRKNPPPFAPDDWTPSSGECMSFILRAVDEAIRAD